MVAILLLLLATAPAGSTPEDIQRWVRQLGARDAGLRDHAARRLLEAGDDGADALEAADFETVEAALRARELLDILRQPSAMLRPPPFVGRDQKMIMVEVLVTNPRPTPLVIEPIFVKMRRGKGVRASKRWKFDLPKGVGGPHLSRGALTRRYEVPARSDFSIPIGFVDHVAGRQSFRIGVSYRGDSFLLDSHATIRVGRESLSMLRLRAYSAREELRSEAITYLRHRLRVGKNDSGFKQTLRIVARSPYRDMRRGVARALTDHGQTTGRAHTEVLTMLAGDRDLTVSRQAFIGLARRAKLRDSPPSLRQLVSKLFARQGDGRTRYLYEMLATLTPRARHQFLSSVLSTNRTRAVHTAIAALLRQEGVPIEPARNGLIPRSQIERLGR